MKRVCNCLESILTTFCSNGRKGAMFLKRPVVSNDVVQPFTQAGARAYGVFVDMLSELDKSFKTFGDLDSFVQSLKEIGVSPSMTMQSIVDMTDAIADGTDCYGS